MYRLAILLTLVLTPALFGQQVILHENDFSRSLYETDRPDLCSTSCCFDNLVHRPSPSKPFAKMVYHAEATGGILTLKWDDYGRGESTMIAYVNSLWLQQVGRRETVSIKSRPESTIKIRFTGETSDAACQLQNVADLKSGEWQTIRWTKWRERELYDDSGGGERFALVLSGKGQVEIDHYQVLGEADRRRTRTVVEQPPRKLPILAARQTGKLSGVTGEELCWMIECPDGKAPTCSNQKVEMKWISPWKSFLMNDPRLGGTDVQEDVTELVQDIGQPGRVLCSYTVGEISDVASFGKQGKVVITRSRFTLPRGSETVKIGGYVNMPLNDKALAWLDAAGINRTDLIFRGGGSSDRAEDITELATQLKAHSNRPGDTGKQLYLQGLLNYPLWRYLFGDPEVDKYQLDNWIGEVIDSRLELLHDQFGYDNRDHYLYSWDEAQDAKLMIQAPIWEIGKDHGCKWYAAIHPRYFDTTIDPKQYYPGTEAWNHWTGKYGRTVGDHIDFWICTERNVLFAEKLHTAGKQYGVYGYPFTDEHSPDAYDVFREEVWKAYRCEADYYFLYSFSDQQGQPIGDGRKMCLWIQTPSGDLIESLMSKGIRRGLWDMRYRARTE